MDVQQERDVKRQLEYLTVTPWEAFIAMVNDQYHFGLMPETTVLVSREALDLERVSVTIGAHRSKRLSNLLPPFKQLTFVFHRLDIGEYLGPLVTVPRDALPKEGYRKVDLIQHVFTRGDNQIKLGDLDLVDEWIIRGPEETLTQHTVEAHPLSLRWYGSLRVDVLGVGASEIPYGSSM